MNDVHLRAHEEAYSTKHVRCKMHFYFLTDCVIK